jgi:hypothetical protein
VLWTRINFASLHAEFASNRHDSVNRSRGLDEDSDCATEQNGAGDGPMTNAWDVHQAGVLGCALGILLD